jgi:hypothetical protein
MKCALVAKQGGDAARRRTSHECADTDRIASLEDITSVVRRPFSGPLIQGPPRLLSFLTECKHHDRTYVCMNMETYDTYGSAWQRTRKGTVVLARTSLTHVIQTYIHSDKRTESLLL